MSNYKLQIDLMIDGIEFAIRRIQSTHKMYQMMPNLMVTDLNRVEVTKAIKLEKRNFGKIE
jgi:hypothetical protein